MRVLHVTANGRTEGWLKNALTFDCATDIELHEVRGATAALETLRDEVFDAILVSHHADDFDALDFIAGLRAGGTEEPVVILGTEDEFEIAPLCYEVGGDGYVCVNTATVRMFLWVLARAVERHQLLRENRRLLQGERQRLRHEHQEADRLLCQQRALIADLESLREPTDLERDEELALSNKPHERNEFTTGATAASADSADCDLPPQLIAHYRELLRAHVIMGFGNLASEMSQLAEMLAIAGVTAPQMMLLHLKVLEELVQGLGARSARHVMTRADLLVLEVMIHLAEGYRRRTPEQSFPARQRYLPGFGHVAT